MNRIGPKIVNGMSILKCVGVGNAIKERDGQGKGERERWRRNMWENESAKWLI